MNKQELTNRLTAIIKSIAFSDEKCECGKCEICSPGVENIEMAAEDETKIGEVATGATKLEEVIDDENSGTEPVIEDITISTGEMVKYNPETGEIWTETENGGKSPLAVGIYETNDGKKITVIEDGMATISEVEVEEVIEEEAKMETVEMSAETLKFNEILSRLEALENTNKTLERLTENFEKINDLVIEMSAQPVVKPIDLKTMTPKTEPNIFDRYLDIAKAQSQLK